LALRGWLLTPDSWLLTPDSWLLTPDSWLLTPDSWLLTPDSWLLTPDSCFAPPASHLLPPVCLTPLNQFQHDRDRLTVLTFVLQEPAPEAFLFTQRSDFQIVEDLRADGFEVSLNFG
jgi:hypothetical protein